MEGEPRWGVRRQNWWEAVTVDVREREEPQGTPRSLIWRGGWMVVPFTEIGNKKQKKRERFRMAGSDLACWF